MAPPPWLRLWPVRQPPGRRPSRDSNACICGPSRNDRAGCAPVVHWSEQSLNKECTVPAARDRRQSVRATRGDTMCGLDMGIDGVTASDRRSRLERHVSALRRCTTCPQMQRPVISGGAGGEQGAARGAGARRQGTEAGTAVRLDGWQDALPVVHRELWTGRSDGSVLDLHGGGVPLFPGKETAGRRSGAHPTGDCELLRMARGRVPDPSTRSRDPGRQAGHRAVRGVSISQRGHWQAAAHPVCRPRDGPDPASSPLGSLSVAPNGAREVPAAGRTPPDRQASGPRPRQVVNL